MCREERVKGGGGKEKGRDFDTFQFCFFGMHPPTTSSKCIYVVMCTVCLCMFLCCVCVCVCVCVV